MWQWGAQTPQGLPPRTGRPDGGRRVMGRGRPRVCAPVRPGPRRPGPGPRRPGTGPTCAAGLGRLAFHLEARRRPAPSHAAAAGAGATQIALPGALLLGTRGPRQGPPRPERPVHPRLSSSPPNPRYSLSEVSASRRSWPRRARGAASAARGALRARPTASDACSRPEIRVAYYYRQRPTHVRAMKSVSRTTNPCRVLRSSSSSSSSSGSSTSMRLLLVLLLLLRLLLLLLLVLVLVLVCGDRPAAHCAIRPRPPALEIFPGCRTAPAPRPGAGRYLSAFAVLPAMGKMSDALAWKYPE